MTASERCDQCKFFILDEPDEAGIGACVRMPPVPVPVWGKNPLTQQAGLVGTLSLRPKVGKNEFCGEWVQNTTRPVGALGLGAAHPAAPPRLIR